MRWLTVVVLALAALSSPRADSWNGWDGGAVDLERIDIQVADTDSANLDWPALAKAIIYLHLQSGRPLTPEALDKTREALSAFGRVETTVRTTKDHALLTIVLHPYRRIAAIAVKGNAPLTEQDVINAMQVAVGDFFHPALLEGQQDSIVQRFKAEGYVAPQVKINAAQDRDGHYRLRVEIDKGPLYHLDQVRFTGNHRLTDPDLKSRISAFRLEALWGARVPYKPRQIRDYTRKLIEIYRSRGFADADVRAETTLDPAHARVLLLFKIDEGPRYTIRFTGNQLFSTATLKKELPLLEIGNRGNRGLRRGVQAIRRRYLEAGYADAQVRWRTLKAAAQNQSREVTITVTEGRLHRLAALTFTGNHHIDSHTLSRTFLTRPADEGGQGIFVAATLEEDLEALHTLYRNKGFLGHQVEKTVRINAATAAVSVEISLQEGAQTLLGRVELADPLPPGVAGQAAKITLKTGTPFLQDQLEEEENRLTAAIAPLGYPHARVRSEVTFSADRTRADVALHIDPGPQVQVGQIFFNGQLRTQESFLQRQIDLAPGEPFNLEKILAAQRDLRDLGVFSTVQVRSIGLKEKNATVPLLVTLQEKKPYFFELGGGYQSDKGLYGRSKLGDRNLCGTAKDGWLSAEVSEVGSLFEAGLSEPRLAGSRFSADAGLYTQREKAFNQQFGTDTTGASLTVSRIWHKYLTTALGLRFERREQFLREGELDPDTDPAVLDPRTILVTTPSVRWDDRDSFIRPHSGRLVNFAVDIYRGLDNALDDFLKYRFDSRLFFAPSEHLVLAARVGVGYLHPYGDGRRIPQDQLLFLGGTNSVRGFSENRLRRDADRTAVGGRLTLLGSLEARYDLGNDFEASLFVDTGSVRQTATDEGNDDFRWTAGVGLGYLTPIGPISLFYGHKLNRRAHENAGRFHLTIGYSF